MTEMAQEYSTKGDAVQPTIAEMNTGKKTIPDPQKRAFAAALRAVIVERFENNQKRASDQMHISQPHLSDLLNLKKSPGLHMVLLVRDLSGKTCDEILGLAAPSGGLAKAVAAEVMASMAASASARYEAPSEPPASDVSQTRKKIGTRVPSRS